MRTSIFAALMAAASLIPGAAMAQRGDEDRRGLDRNARGVAIETRETVDQSRPDRGPRPDRSPPQARADRGDGDLRADRGDRGGRGDFGNRGVDRRGPEGGQPGLVAQVDRGDRGGGRGDDRRGPGSRDNGGQWRGNDAGQGGGQWRGNDDRSGSAQWRGNDDRGQWHGTDRRQDYRGNQGNWPGNRQGNWNRGWRQDNRYDWNRRRQINRNAFHLPRYYAPSGWGYGYRRFNVGITLNSGLFSRNYWIDNAYGYGLPEAYGPYRWVRYYNDALLVDVYSGQVVDTVYDIFW